MYHVLIVVRLVLTLNDFIQLYLCIDILMNLYFSED